MHRGESQSNSGPGTDPGSGTKPIPGTEPAARLQLPEIDRQAHEHPDDAQAASAGRPWEQLDLLTWRPKRGQLGLFGDLI